MKIIAGVDEVGRGSLIGPVYAAAVILNKSINKKLLKEICEIKKIPIIYNGGIKDIDDIKSSFKFGLEAVGVGSYFVFYGKLKAVLISYPTNEIKKFINE